MMQYLKHLAFNTAKRGWNVVVSNHRGLGGVSVTVSGVVVEISCFKSLSEYIVRVCIPFILRQFPE